MENRRAPRFNVEYPHIALIAFSGPDQIPIGAQVINIGQGGVGIKIPGNLVKYLPSPNQGPWEAMLNLDGVVGLTCSVDLAWFVGTSSHGKRILYSGLFLSKLNSNDNRILLDYVSKLSKPT